MSKCPGSPTVCLHIVVKLQKWEFVPLGLEYISVSFGIMSEGSTCPALPTA